MPVLFNFSGFRNSEIHKVFGEGIRTLDEYNMLLNKYGMNLISLKNKSFVMILLENIVQPLYIYQIFSVSVWLKNENYVFCLFVFLIFAVIIVMNSRQSHKNYRRIVNMTVVSKINIKRNFVIMLLVILGNEPKYDT